MTDIIDRYHEAYRMYNKSLNFIEKYSSSYCKYIEEAINSYFNQHSIDNKVTLCDFTSNINMLKIGTEKIISIDDLSAIAEALYLDITFYNGTVFHFAIKEE